MSREASNGLPRHFTMTFLLALRSTSIPKRSSFTARARTDADLALLDGKL